jgi:hypothetical protein
LQTALFANVVFNRLFMLFLKSRVARPLLLKKEFKNKINVCHFSKKNKQDIVQGMITRNSTFTEKLVLLSLKFAKYKTLRGILLD